jgi:hypothetical protein
LSRAIASSTACSGVMPSATTRGIPPHHEVGGPSAERRQQDQQDDEDNGAHWCHGARLRIGRACNGAHHRANRDRCQ